MAQQGVSAKLGVGFGFHPGLSAELLSVPGLLQFTELSPDVLCREQHAGATPRLVFDDALLDDALAVSARAPLVVHGLSLSIGSPHGMNTQYLSMLDELAARRSFLWHSEHLAYMQVKSETGELVHTGIPLPIPQLDAALAMLVPRVRAVQRRYGVPFLLENLTHYLPDMPRDGERDEVDFLNALCRQSGAGLLLDLYNFHCNALNHGFDPFEALARLELEHVREVHVAGGASFEGFVMDVHSREVPGPVWDMLGWLVKRAPNLSGIVFEVLEEAVPLLGKGAVQAQLERCQDAWQSHLASAAPHTRARATERTPACELAPLQELQDALGCLVRTTGSPDAGLALSERPTPHAAWLASLRHAPGLRITAYIARWWRETKLQKRAPLTIAALRSTNAYERVQRHLDERAVESLFFMAEALSFLRSVCDDDTLDPAVRAVAGFEHALLRTREAQRAYAPPDLRADVELVAFPAPVEAVLAAVLQGAPFPDADGRAHLVALGPHIPHGWECR